MDETTLHALGRSQYVADLPLPPGCLHASPVLAPLAHARIDSIDASAALALPGVKAVLSAADIRGENQIGVVFADEPLLAAGRSLHYAGQVLALVVASECRHCPPRRQPAAIKPDTAAAHARPTAGAASGCAVWQAASLQLWRCGCRLCRMRLAGRRPH
jgi:xanthine dehydrogenase molybdopterin-binding subunit B